MTARSMILAKERAAIANDLEQGRVGHVYFISNPEQHVMKIGYAGDVWKRLETMQTSTHVDLFIYFAFKTAFTSERVLHRLMQRYRIRKEWFAFEAEMDNLIECFEDYDIVHGKDLVDGDALERILEDWWSSYGRKELSMSCVEVWAGSP